MLEWLTSTLGGGAAGVLLRIGNGFFEEFRAGREHARKLEEAGYLTCTKGYDGRVPRTDFKITAAGRRALDAYLGHMEALIRRVGGA